MLRRSKTQTIACYVMILPMIIGLLVFTIYPTLWNMRYAFYDFDGVDAIYVGMKNFVRIFTRDSHYWMSIVNAILISYVKLIVEIPLALICAVLLARNTKFSGFFRGVYFLPTIIGTSVTAVIFSKIFATYPGFINELLIKFGWIETPINFFGEKWWAIGIIMLMSIWQNFGVNVLFFMSGVLGISNDYYEAASIDGASSVQQFFKITLPMLKPVTRTILLLAMTSGIKLMDAVMLLTNGGPGGSTDVVMLYMYKNFFATDTSAQIGYAAAMGIVTTIILCIISIVYLRLSKEKE